ncbi:polyketide cyclase, partial [Clostridium perfringens]
EFRVTATFEGFDGRTRVPFRQLFKKKEEFEQAKPICIEANEQQLDRLGKVLAELADSPVKLN